jgi:hypothetical protein
MNHPPSQPQSLYTNCQPITGQIYTDPTGHFHVPSINGDAYMLIILYEYDSNFMHVEPMKNRMKEEHLAAY